MPREYFTKGHFARTYHNTSIVEPPEKNPASATVRSPRARNGRISSQNDLVIPLHTKAAWEPAIGGQDLRANVCGYSKSSLPASGIGATRPLALATALALALALALPAASTAGSGWGAELAFLAHPRLPFFLAAPSSPVACSVQSSSPAHAAHSSSVQRSPSVHVAHSSSVQCSPPVHVAQSSCVQPSSPAQSSPAGASTSPPLLLLLLAAASPRPPRPRPRDLPGLWKP